MKAHPRRSLPFRHRSQRGIAAVEFALIFPLFFVLLYAIVTYGMIFLAQQTLTAAAAEGARAALVYQNAGSPDAALTARAKQACSRASSIVTWLAGTTCTRTVNTAPGGCTDNTAMDCIQITLNYPYAAKPLMPILPFMGVAVPQSLAAEATVQIDPENLL